MHLVNGSETYKTASGVVTQALGRLDEIPLKVGGVQCKMTFMVVDTDSYDILLGLDLLIKIGAIVDVEQGLIQVRRGPGSNVEVLPLTVVNLMQKADQVITNCGSIERQTSEQVRMMETAFELSQQVVGEQDSQLGFASDSDSNESSAGENLKVNIAEGSSEFGNTELEDLALSEGPRQILGLVLQDKADDLIREEVADKDDYADWIQWAADAERNRPLRFEVKNSAEEFAMQPIQQKQIEDPLDDVVECIMRNPKEDTRWSEICQKIRIDKHLDKGMEQQLWGVLEQFQDVFAWNKGELGCCSVGEHQIDTQGFPPCRVPPGRLSYWEETEVNRQINVLVELGKMRPSNSSYACRVTLPIKKDGSRRFCGDYRPLNLQTRRDSFPMPLVDDIISQLGKSA
jgi:hypothetical protein